MECKVKPQFVATGLFRISKNVVAPIPFLLFRFEATKSGILPIIDAQPVENATIYGVSDEDQSLFTSNIIAPTATTAPPQSNILAAVF